MCPLVVFFTTLTWFIMGPPMTQIMDMVLVLALFIFSQFFSIQIQTAIFIGDNLFFPDNQYVIISSDHQSTGAGHVSNLPKSKSTCIEIKNNFMKTARMSSNVVQILGQQYIVYSNHCHLFFIVSYISIFLSANVHMTKFS